LKALKSDEMMHYFETFYHFERGILVKYNACSFGREGYNCQNITKAEEGNNANLIIS